MLSFRWDEVFVNGTECLEAELQQLRYLTRPSMFLLGLYILDIVASYKSYIHV